MYKYIDIKNYPELIDRASSWFSSKWNVPKEAYIKCMSEYINNQTEYGWYLCLDENKIIGGLGVIDNDFHNRKDLTPNVCAVYVEEKYRNKGIAGNLLTLVVNECKSKNITPLYLLTEHTGFYERYGWEFLCLVQGDGEDHLSRMYIHN